MKRTLAAGQRFVWLMMNVVHSRLRAFVCVVSTVFAMSLTNLGDVSTRSGWHGLSLVRIVSCGPIKPALAHVSASSLGSNLQSHIVDVMTGSHLLLRTDNHNIVTSVLIGLQWVRCCVVTLVILGIVRLLLAREMLLLLLLLLLQLLLLVNCFTKKTFVGAVHSCGLRLHKRVL